MSTSLYGGEQLDRLPVPQHHAGPRPARCHGAVDGGGDTLVRGQTGADQLRQRHAVGELGAFAVDDEDHAGTSVRVKRSGENAAMTGGTASPATRAATPSPVTGASRMPLR